MTNPNIDLPSQRKYFDVSAIEDCKHSTYQPSKYYCGKHAPKRDKSLLQTFFLVLVVVLTVLVLNAVVDGLMPQKAQAKTIELRDCRTNAECERIYCSGEAMNYVQDKSICHD